MLMLFQDKKIIALILIAILLGGYVYFEGLGIFLIDEKKEKEAEPIVEVLPEPTLQIIDQDSDSRVYAVMINNHPVAALNHSGLQDAFIVYEVIVEGGFTRMMALYRDQTTERIGSVRSARHYYLDYALEYDAVFVHFGGSPQSYQDIRSLRVDNLDFMVRIGYIRDRSLNVAWEHKAYTSIELIEEQLKKMNRRVTSDTTYLNYSIEPILLDENEDAIKADSLKINYSRSTIVNYDYLNGYYYRVFNNKPHVDTVTEEQYNFKNIIIMHAKNYLMGSKGRQELNTVGSGVGYFITDGYAVPITWKKDSRSSKTTYLLANDEEVVFNDGNTIFQVVPINAKIEILSPEEIEEELE